jgi:hypothetical protein
MRTDSLVGPYARARANVAIRKSVCIGPQLRPSTQNIAHVRRGLTG